MASSFAVTSSLHAILERAGTPDEFGMWLKAKGLVYPIDLYGLAADETRIGEQILDGYCVGG